MKRRGLFGISCCLMLAYAALVAGCTEFVTESARTSLAGFFSTVITEGINSTVAPQN